MKQKNPSSFSFFYYYLIAIIGMILLITYFLIKNHRASASPTQDPIQELTVSSADSLIHEALGLYWIKIQRQEPTIMLPNISWVVESTNLFNSSVYFIDVRVMSIKNTLNLSYPADMNDDSLLLLFTLYPKKRQLFLDDYQVPNVTSLLDKISENKIFCRNQFLNY